MITIVINERHYNIPKNLLRDTKLVEYLCNRYEGNMENNYLRLGLNSFMQQILQTLFSYRPIRKNRLFSTK